MSSVAAVAIALLAILRNSPIGVVIALTVSTTPRTVRGVAQRGPDPPGAAVHRGCGGGRGAHADHPGEPHPARDLPCSSSRKPFSSVCHSRRGGISFVGLGVQPPQPSWGNILGDAQGCPERGALAGRVPRAGDHDLGAVSEPIGTGCGRSLDPKRRKTSGGDRRRKDVRSPA